jgi:hypothetical protein
MEAHMPAFVSTRYFINVVHLDDESAVEALTDPLVTLIIDHASPEQPIELLLAVAIQVLGNFLDECDSHTGHESLEPAVQVFREAYEAHRRSRIS